MGNIIKKFNEFSINEGVKSLLVGPNKDDVWKSFGYDRSFDTPEEFFSYVINNMKIKEQILNPNYIFWEINGKIIFKQDLINKILWVDCNLIDIIFRQIFKMSNSVSYKFIIDYLEKYLKWERFRINSSLYLNIYYKNLNFFKN